MILYRLMQWSRRRRLAPLEMVFNKLNAVFCNCIIGRGAEFGPGLVLIHSDGRGHQRPGPGRVGRHDRASGDHRGRAAAEPRARRRRLPRGRGQGHRRGHDRRRGPDRGQRRGPPRRPGRTRRPSASPPGSSGVADPGRPRPRSPGPTDGPSLDRPEDAAMTTRRSRSSASGPAWRLVAYAYAGYPAADLGLLARLRPRRPSAARRSADDGPADGLAAARGLQRGGGDRRPAPQRPGDGLPGRAARDRRRLRRQHRRDRRDRPAVRRPGRPPARLRREPGQGVGPQRRGARGSRARSSCSPTPTPRSTPTRRGGWSAGSRDPTVGVVVGRLVLVDPATGRNADGLYWKYETFLKRCEARLGALLGANGAIYAIRRDLLRRRSPPGRSSTTS